MNETQKTGVFWGVAAVVALIATVIAWPSSNDSGGVDEDRIGEQLCVDFKDPLDAASLKIVTFNETQGELKNFEVRKDPDSGLWTIPSKGGYPADAVEQMRDAANALVGLKILDVPTVDPEDHAGMGVVEPKLEDLNPGDEGVGRMVTFKDKSQKVLGSVIVGKEVKGQEGQVYVRIPGQDPVYVVKLDDKPLSTKFQDWIEEDLLQLSSIDVENVVVKDYSASLGIQGVSLVRNYDVVLEKDGATWELDALQEYDKEDPLAPPTPVEIDLTKKLNTQKLNDLTNALDDLKFVDVKRKPEGISANLKADSDFASDREAASQLARQGFIPLPLGPNREIEIMSANGELTATTKDGVQYILRFGNISGITEGDGEDKSSDSEDSAGGVNRFLMVSTMVDESKIPVPELKPIPQTQEELEALERPAPPEGVELPPELNTPETSATEEPTTEEPVAETPKPEMKEAGDGADAKSESVKSESAEAEPEKTATPEEKTEPKETVEEPKEAASQSGDAPAESSAEKPSESGETDASGEGESTTVGEAQEAVADDQANPDDAAVPPADAAEEAPATETKEPELTEEEKLERLAAVQEKITKENQRKLDERKERLEQARIQSKMLNERFADWYYVIPEETYAKLRISRDDLYDTSGDSMMPNPAALPPGLQGLGGPGFGN
ncbi:MAG: DUF4340 domain-containing protein [Planctomycetales bacterium]|nr:DUF4340 domain-containing protein [Planctomycetales bacterium]